MATIAGQIVNFLPGNYGIMGDQVSAQNIASLFNELDVTITASADNAQFLNDTGFAASSDGEYLILPDGAVEVTIDVSNTSDANTTQIIDQMAQANLRLAAIASGATLDLSFSESISPNSNKPVYVSVLTTNMPSQKVLLLQQKF